MGGMGVSFVLEQDLLGEVSPNSFLTLLLPPLVPVILASLLFLKHSKLPSL